MHLFPPACHFLVRPIHTGTLSVTRKQWDEIIYRNGGSTSPRVTQHTTHVVCGTADGLGTLKHSAAQQRGIPCVTEQFMLRLIKSRGAAVSAADVAVPATLGTATAGGAAGGRRRAAAVRPQLLLAQTYTPRAAGVVMSL